MCGINGIVGLDNTSLLTQTITAMNFAIKHRGPDDNGVWTEGAIGFGHTRLSIIDLSSLGHQPMFSNDRKLVLVYNGELYNFKELKSELQSSYAFKTNSDTEVILAAYQKWGVDCLKRFDGMFAFALYDYNDNQVIVARDRLGVKPLYYNYSNSTLLFSSEMRAILKSNLVKRKIYKPALATYLRYQTVYSPDTIIEGVKILPAGHFMVFKNATLQVTKYWDVTTIDTSSCKGKSYDDITTDIRKLLFDSVEKRLVADVPFGAFLSGGIDSSAIVAIMSKLNKGKVKTFSVVFDEAKFSEAKYSQIVANKYKTEHHEINLTVSDFKKELPNALAAMDYPTGDGVNSYVIAKATKNAGVSMALSGIGSDELFAGYDVFRRTKKINTYNWVSTFPNFLKKIAAASIANLKPSVASDKFSELLMEPNWDIDSIYKYSRKVLSEKQLQEMSSNLWQEKNLFDDKMDAILSEESLSLLNGEYNLSRISLLEIGTYLENVLLRDTDQMSMAHALEVREPFLDYKLMQYVLAVPDNYKYPVTPKKLLVDSLSDLIPLEIINRPKMGFTFPWKEWMKGDLRLFCEQSLISLGEREYFNKNYLMNRWKLFLNNHPSVTWSRIWYLVVLENWMKQNNIE
ncbi:MAG: asparagine synthase (glutamine-hydrolyzing) [Bacteroidetes bacterium]|nr:asparagine synthase (glutamine-hydrolyzing) [Bacteroidota bacterium]